MVKSTFFRCNSHALFLNSCAFSASFTEEIKLSPSYTAHLIKYNAVDIWRENREQTLNTNAIAYLSHCK